MTTTLDSTSSNTPSVASPKSASDIFSIHAAIRPNKLALICGERVLTYLPNFCPN